MESARGGRYVQRDPPRPSLHVEAELVNVVETFEGQVDAAKDIHGLLSVAGRVPITTLDIAMNLVGLKPDSQV